MADIDDDIVFMSHHTTPKPTPTQPPLHIRMINGDDDNVLFVVSKTIPKIPTSTLTRDSQQPLPATSTISNPTPQITILRRLSEDKQTKPMTAGQLHSTISNQQKVSVTPSHVKSILPQQMNNGAVSITDTAKQPKHMIQILNPGQQNVTNKSLPSHSLQSSTITLDLTTGASAQLKSPISSSASTNVLKNATRETCSPREASTSPASSSTSVSKQVVKDIDILSSQSILQNIRNKISILPQILQSRLKKKVPTATTATETQQTKSFLSNQRDKDSNSLVLKHGEEGADDAQNSSIHINLKNNKSVTLKPVKLVEPQRESIETIQNECFNVCNNNKGIKILQEKHKNKKKSSSSMNSRGRKPRPMMIPLKKKPSKVPAVNAMVRYQLLRMLQARELYLRRNPSEVILNRPVAVLTAYVKKKVYDNPHSEIPSYRPVHVLSCDKLFYNGFMPIVCEGLSAVIHLDKFFCPGTHRPCIEFDGTLISPILFTDKAGLFFIQNWKAVLVASNGRALNILFDMKTLDFTDHDKFCTGLCRKSYNAGSPQVVI